MDAKSTKEVMTIEELADYWGVTKNSVRQANFQGNIPGSHVGPNGRPLFDAEVAIAGWKPQSVKRWERQNKNPSLTGLRLAKDEAERRLATIGEVVTPEKWVLVIEKALVQAISGDWRARQWLSNYLMGKPLQRVAAELEVTTRRDFSPEERAATIEALLDTVRERVEGEIVDVIPRRASGTSDASGEVST